MRITPLLTKRLMGETRWIAIDAIKTDPILSGIWPIESETVNLIVESIQVRGFDEAEPIVLWKSRCVVVDGHTRLAAARKAKLFEVPIFEHEFQDEDEAVFYAVGRQQNRRSLRPGDILRLVADLDMRLKRQQGRTKDIFSNGKNSSASHKQIADIISMSPATVSRARSVNAEPIIAAQVDTGELSLGAGADLAREAKQARMEAVPVHPSQRVTGTNKPVLDLITRTVQRIGKSEVLGVYTVNEWAALNDGERHELLTQSPLEHKGGFNRTNENVEWALWTWNPVTGCLHNCPYCYARDIAARFYPQGFIPALIPERLSGPQHQRVPAAAATNIGEKNVFVCSMADLFGKWVPQAWIDAVLAQTRSHPEWNFLFLTKFPRRLSQQEWPDNAWVGTTVDKQFRVDLAEKSFSNVRAGVKWLSCEPMLEPLKFNSLEMFDWVVVGGASRSSQTPEFQPPIAWFEDLLNQARRAGCKVYLKPNFENRWREYPGFDDLFQAPEIGSGWVDGEPNIELDGGR